MQFLKNIFDLPLTSQSMKRRNVLCPKAPVWIDSLAAFKPDYRTIATCSSYKEARKHPVPGILSPVFKVCIFICRHLFIGISNSATTLGYLF